VMFPVAILTGKPTGNRDPEPHLMAEVCGWDAGRRATARSTAGVTVAGKLNSQIWHRPEEIGLRPDPAGSAGQAAGRALEGQARIASQFAKTDGCWLPRELVGDSRRAG
jgi:hypothetical protein